MKLQHDTIKYNIEEALVYLKRLLKEVKNKTLTEEEFIPEMEHILCHLNFSVNARHLSRKKASKLSQSEYEKHTRPPRARIPVYIKNISKIRGSKMQWIKR